MDEVCVQLERELDITIKTCFLLPCEEVEDLDNKHFFVESLSPSWLRVGRPMKFRTDDIEIHLDEQFYEDREVVRDFIYQTIQQQIIKWLDSDSV